MSTRLLGIADQDFVKLRKIKIIVEQDMLIEWTRSLNKNTIIDPNWTRLAPKKNPVGRLALCLNEKKKTDLWSDRVNIFHIWWQFDQLYNLSDTPAMSPRSWVTRFGPKWVRLAPNGTNTGDFFQIQYILARLPKIYWICFEKISGFVPFGDNLTHLVRKSDISVLHCLICIQNRSFSICIGLTPKRVK